jgi:hypothetical protein
MGSLESGVKTIIGTNPVLEFLCKHCTVFSDKLAMATSHAMLINLHQMNNAIIQMNNANH